MTFVFAVIGIAALGFLLWRAFGPHRAVADPDRPSHPYAGSHGPLGPDDDAEFLRDLDRRTRGPNGSDSDEV